MHVPDGPQDLTPEWLTQALRETETIKKAHVLSFKTHTLGEEKGITGQLARLNLEYDVDEEDVPHSLIAKFHSADPETRVTAKMLRMYECEVQFYQQIVRQIELRTPRCYYSAIDENEKFVLLLEDLAPASSLDTISGCSFAEAKLAIQHIAKFHTTWWESPQLAKMDWLLQSNPVYFQQFLHKVQELLQNRWKPFLKKVGHTFPHPMQKLGERLVESFVEIGKHLYLQAPRTLIHHDFQLDNLFYATPQGGVPFAVVDWQQLWIGRGTYDIAFFLCRCLPPKERQTVERKLLKMYHTTFVEHGIQEYTFEQCMYDYRLIILECLARLVIVIAGNLTPEMGQAFCDVLLPRNCAAILDLNAGEVLPR